MSRKSSQFVCQNCGAVFPRYQGQCYHCGEWNTIVEESVQPVRSSVEPAGPRAEPVPLPDIDFKEITRIKTGISEFDRVTGGGIVPGSLILVGGSPGIGKSTLLLSAAEGVARKYFKKVLYVTGEESLEQIKMRAQRLNLSSENLEVYPEIELDKIIQVVSEKTPGIVIIDSIQTMIHPDIGGTAGSVSQVRECAGTLQRLSKSSGIPVIIVGHITRSGSIAGPMQLEHVVDTVLYFEGENVRDFRILRSLKNRFGSTREIGVFVMESTGLQGVENPSKFFLAHRETGVPGSVVVPVIEGTRTLLVEVQALVSQSSFGMPARRAEGVSINRVTLLLAVMEKRAKMILGGNDVFVNVVGGVQVDEPAADLGIVSAIVSSFRDRPLSTSTVVIGEVGLGGEIRGVSRIGDRLSEASRMGFKRALIPGSNLSSSFEKIGMEIIGVENIRQAVEVVF